MIAPDAGMTRSLAGTRAEATALVDWVKPQLTKLVDEPPDGPEWLHEIKFDGYRMHTRLDRGTVRLLPSRPGEFHPEPLTDPDLNLSIHPARVTARRLPPSAEPSGSSRFDSVGP